MSKSIIHTLFLNNTSQASNNGANVSPGLRQLCLTLLFSNLWASQEHEKRDHAM